MRAGPTATAILFFELRTQKELNGGGVTPNFKLQWLRVFVTSHFESLNQSVPRSSGSNAVQKKNSTRQNEELKCATYPLPTRAPPIEKRIEKEPFTQPNELLKAMPEFKDKR
jgi:hypothetical protein